MRPTVACTVASLPLLFRKKNPPTSRPTPARTPNKMPTMAPALEPESSSDESSLGFVGLSLQPIL
eukprot:scaffold1248_cov393-Prasinococcus_capsulatus_cf.AAC.37